MARGVLRSADVEVHVLPILVGLLAHECLVVVRIHIAEVVGAGSGEARHGAEFDGEDGLMVDESLFDHAALLRVPGPLLGASQWRLATLGGLVGVDLGQLQRQAVFGNHIGHVVLVIDGEGLTPVALAGENGVAQAVVDLDLADALLGDKRLGLGDGLLDGQSVERECGVHTLARRVHDRALLGVETLLADVGSLDERDDGQLEVASEGVVA